MSNLMTQINVHHSIRTALLNEFSMPVTWIFDGVSLPSSKPFMTIEQLQNNVSSQAKLRESIRTIYRFQVGLSASTSSERAALQERISRFFLKHKIPLIDTSNPLSRSGYFFYVEPNFSVVPISADDVSDKTQYHRVYFTIEVSATYNARK